MSILESLLAVAATKAGAAAVGLTVAAGAAGAAGALPDDVQTAFDRAFATDHAAEQSVDTAELPADTDAHGEQELNGTDDQGVARDVHDTLNGEADVWPGDEGFGQAVADNAREDGAAFGSSIAEAASSGRASQGQDHATTGDDAAEAGADNADAAEARADNADAADEHRDGAGEQEAEAGEANAEVADDYRPENPPEDAGEPDELPEQSGAGQDAAGDHVGR